VYTCDEIPVCSSLEFPDGVCDYPVACGDALQTAVAECGAWTTYLYGFTPEWWQEGVVEDFDCTDPIEGDTYFSFRCTTVVYPCDPCFED
jgi:hypothetical protein